MKKFSVVFLMITTFMMIVFNGYEFIVRDKEAPVISCPDNEIRASVTVTEEELLKGVTAEDNRSDDVTKSMVIEKMSALDDDNARVITYAAIDDAGNVGRKERTLIYTDYTAPKFEFAEPLRFSLGNIPDNPIKYISAVSSVEGDISEKIKFQLTADQYLNVAGVYDVEIRVTDNAGVTSVIPTQIDLYDAKEEAIKVELNQYIVYINVGDTFDTESYYKSASIDGALSIDSNVDTESAGTYHVDYTVQANEEIGKSRLIVVVE